VFACASRLTFHPRYRCPVLVVFRDCPVSLRWLIRRLPTRLGLIITCFDIFRQVGVRMARELPRYRPGILASCRIGRDGGGLA
jgi:hypothetical protein